MDTAFSYDCGSRLVHSAHLFTGKERDTESGNDYFGARYYGSSMGRFMSPDPSMEGAILELPQTWNKYSYMYNRPTYGTDPDGRCPPCIGAIVGGVVEGGFDLGKQFVSNGYSFKGTNWQEVGANTLGGAIAGGLRSCDRRRISRRKCCGWGYRCGGHSYRSWRSSHSRG